MQICSILWQVATVTVERAASLPSTDRLIVLARWRPYVPAEPTNNKGKGKGKKYSSSQTASPLRELTCHMGSHSVTCHPAEVTSPPLPQLIKASTRFSDPGAMQGWVDLVGLVTYRGGTPARRWSPIPVLTGRAQRRATSFMRRTTLPLRQTANHGSLGPRESACP